MGLVVTLGADSGAKVLTLEDVLQTRRSVAAWATRPNLMTQHTQIAEHNCCYPHARSFRLRFARVVAVLLGSRPSGVRGPVLLPP
jgi:hypothetical protein